MTELLFLRHGITDWNVARRMQGRQDIPINDEGREMVGAWRLPERFAAAALVASPLVRARETAEIVKANHPGLGDLQTDERLMERSWGVWEGRNLHEMEADVGPEIHSADLRPEGGESRRDLLGRIAGFLSDIASRDAPAVVVTHRGVIRTVYGIATGWDLAGETPDEMSRRRGQVFRALPGGGAELAQLNLSLKG
ncbi:MAG: histidine phosphatase family protein [Alphaproteobacteria bacterium]|nr:histidine phosphatase family protein [Alphaproteobacteria bacterium]